MSAFAIIFAGIAVAFNILIIFWKIEQGRSADAVFDTVFLILIGWVFSGSLAGLVIGTVASAIISMALIVHPPDNLISKMNKGREKGKKARRRRRI